MQFLIAIIIGAGAGIWAYGWEMRKTGNNAKSSYILGGVVGFIVFVVLLMLASRLLSS